MSSLTAESFYWCNLFISAQRSQENCVTPCFSMKTLQNSRFVTGSTLNWLYNIKSCIWVFTPLRLLARTAYRHSYSYITWLKRLFKISATPQPPIPLYTRKAQLFLSSVAFTLIASIFTASLPLYSRAWHQYKSILVLCIIVDIRHYQPQSKVTVFVVSAFQ